jgi:hypothetical protein
MQPNYNKILNDPNYVFLKRFGYSLCKVMERYPEGCPDHVIAPALQVTEDEVDILYKRVIAKLQQMVVDEP